MTLLSGNCVGGPHHGEPLHHGTAIYDVAVHPTNTSRRMTRAGPDDGAVFGYYAYEATKGIWIWYPPPPG